MSASEIAAAPGTTLDLGFVRSLETADTSYGAALGTLAAATAGDVSAEALVEGNPALRAGARVSIDGAGRRFDGAYYVTKTTHTFAPESTHAWRTRLQIVRADRASYFLPEVGDEVLVAFARGDLRQPFVVGSLWDGNTNPPEEASPCGTRSRGR